MYSKRYWALRSISLASDQIIAGVGMAIAHLLAGIRLPVWLVAVIYTLLVVKDVFIMWPCIAVSRLWPMTGKEGMIGKVGEAVSDLAPSGILKIENEIWKARVESGTLQQGKPAQVVDVDGLTLKVRHVEDGE
jgi:membrane-bound ClpP family serine protease